MAKFLNTQQISSEINSLIKEAKQELTLVSYSLKVHLKLLERIENQIENHALKEVCIISGSKTMKDEEFNKLRKLPRVKLLQRDDLHAKCYLNEHTAIVCSMNLYDYSQQNNIEYGILITKEDDALAYNELYSELQFLKNAKHTKVGYIDQENIPGNKVLELTIDERLKYSLLREWKERLDRSKSSLIPDALLIRIVQLGKKDVEQIQALLPTILKKMAYDIKDILRESKYYWVGHVLDTRIPSKGYPQVKFKNAYSQDVMWYDTTQVLPESKKDVGVKINGNWFNEYLYLSNELSE